MALTLGYERFVRYQVDDTTGAVILVGVDGLPLATPVVEYMSAVASSITGTTAETTLGTVTIPAGLIGANGQVEVVTAWTVTNSANNKVMKVVFGGSNIMATTVTTVATQQTYQRIANRNSEEAQVSFSPFSVSGLSNTSTAISTFTVNTAVDTVVNFTGTLANTGETITLESYIVIVHRRA